MYLKISSGNIQLGVTLKYNANAERVNGNELPGKTECIRGVNCDYLCFFVVILQMDVQGSVIVFLITWHGGLGVSPQSR